VADARILGWTALCVALLDRDLVIRVALFFQRLLARIGLFHRQFLLRVSGNPVHLGIGLGLDQRSVRFLHADVLGIAGNVVAFFLGDVVSRFGTHDARILTRLRSGPVRGFRIGL